MNENELQPTVLHLDTRAEAGDRIRGELAAANVEISYTRADTFSAFQAHLSQPWDALLFREVDADRVFKETGALKAKPAFIVLADTTERQSALRLLARGADDVVSASDLTRLAVTLVRATTEVRERRALYKALREARGRLEHRVEERTAELQMLNRLLRQEMEERQRAEHNLRTARLALTRLREDERLRVSREIHDGVVQDLLGIGFAMADTERQTTTASADLLQSAVAKHRSDVLSAVRRLRQTIKGLRPPGLAEFGLTNALSEFVTSLQATVTATDIQLNIAPKAAKLPEAVAQCFYRVTQEAVRNALRYSGASAITIEIAVEESTAWLAVHDNGRGFEPPRFISALAAQNHYGLVGMDEQASLVGGDLEVLSTLAEGTEVRVTVPLRD